MSYGTMATCAPISYLLVMFKPPAFRIRLAAALLGASAVLASRAGAQDLPPVPDSLQLDPVARLQVALDEGRIELAHDSAWGYLPALLEALEIPISSQGLVFSRTSLQTDRIAPWAPRALYFNDDVYVGWVQESPIIEIASVDPDDGAVFYTLPQDPDRAPSFERETTTCHMCHASAITNDVPGFMVLSVLADRSGYPVTEIHQDATTDKTPMSERWGGWYVTGTSSDVHAGNQRAQGLLHEIDAPRERVRELDLARGSDVTELDDHFYTDAYLSPHSDIVALMVLAHQAHVHNLMAVAQRQTAAAIRDQEAVLRTTGDAPPSGGFLPITRVRIETVTERLVEGMLFVDEAPLGGPVEGTSGFAEEFQAMGPFDDQGRSLRALDLESRLFRYPMSFLVHSDAFRTLPAPVKQTFWRRVHEILAGEDDSGRYDHIDAEARAELLDILMATVPEFRIRFETDAFDPI